MSQEPQKIQLCAKLSFFRVLYYETDIPEDDRIEMYANSLITPVYTNGVLHEVYWQMVEKTMSVLATIIWLESGWKFEEDLKINVKFARFRPIHGSSYTALQSKIFNCSGLIEAGNHEDTKILLRGSLTLAS